MMVRTGVDLEPVVETFARKAAAAIHDVSLLPGGTAVGNPKVAGPEETIEDETRHQSLACRHGRQW
jgi:hypothetical protein